MSETKARLKIACPNCRQKLDLSDLEPFARVPCPRCSGEVIAPKRFGPVLLEEPLGRRRGIGSYRALDLTLDREVLVQILEETAESHGEAFLALARRAAPLNHPGLVPIYSCGTQEGQPYVVSQYLPGGVLARRLAGWGVSEDSVRQGLGWALAAAGGLQAAAVHAVVHGAVSPWSILLDGEEHAKVADFGFDVLLCGPGGRAGSYPDELTAYLSPEVLGGDGPTMAADVFGLGAVLYHMLTGRPPCGPAVDGASARRLWQMGHVPAAPCGTSVAVPQSLSDLCLRMLSVDPSQRPSDMGSIVQGLTAASKTRASPAARDGDRQRSRSPVLPALKAFEQRQQQSALALLRRRRRWVDVLIAAGAVAVLVLGALAYVRARGWPSWLLPMAPHPGAASPAASPPAEAGTVGQPGVVAAAGDPTGGSQAPSPAPAAGPPGVEAGPAGTDTGTPGSLPADDPGEPAAPGASLGSQTSRRPRPEGLDFLTAKEDLAAYLQHLPAALRNDERDRIELISDIRGYLVRLMKYVPFAAGKDTDVRLRNGRTIRGSVPYCNDTQVAVRPAGEGALHMVPWREVAFEQVVSFLDFYVRLRLDQGRMGDGTQDSNRQREAGEDCLRLAVLCDWYERGTLAARYARQAVDVDPQGAARVKRLLPQVQF